MQQPPSFNLVAATLSHIWSLSFLFFIVTKICCIQLYLISKFSFHELDEACYRVSFSLLSWFFLIFFYQIGVAMRWTGLVHRTGRVTGFGRVVPVLTGSFAWLIRCSIRTGHITGSTGRSGPSFKTMVIRVMFWLTQITTQITSLRFFFFHSHRWELRSKSRFCSPLLILNHFSSLNKQIQSLTLSSPLLAASSLFNYFIQTQYLSVSYHGP